MSFDLTVVLILVMALLVVGGVLLASRRELGRLRRTLSEREREVGSLAANLESERKHYEGRLVELGRIHDQIADQVRGMLHELLVSQGKTFLEQASLVFRTQHDQGQEGLKGLLAPMQSGLEKFREHIARMEEERKKDEGSLLADVRRMSEAHQRLDKTTSELVHALRSAPKVPGKWGELQLRTLLEMAGMEEHVDFNSEVTISRGEQRLRPDVVIRIPGNRRLVVDAKTSLSAYLEALDCPEDDERERKLQEHARQVRDHAMDLGKKSYWQGFSGQSVDFVIMFVPGEPMFTAAMARDPELLEEAWRRKVLICSPTTLLAAARTMAHSWHQERMGQQAREIQDTGIELYKRLCKLGSAVQAISVSLESHVRKHNEFIGTLEGSVLPKARQLGEFVLPKATYGDIGVSDGVGRSVRLPASGRDMDLRDAGGMVD